MTETKLSEIERYLQKDNRQYSNYSCSNIEHRYNGNIKNNRYNGKGTIETEEYILKGLFVDNSLEEGIMHYKNGVEKRYYCEKYILIKNSDYILYCGRNSRMGFIVTNNALIYYSYYSGRVSDIYLTYDKTSDMIKTIPSTSISYQIAVGRYKYFDANVKFADRYGIINSMFKKILFTYGIDLSYVMSDEHEYIGQITTTLTNTGMLCVVCMVNYQNVLFTNCKHLCLCEDCSNKSKGRCPICRQPGTTMKIFLC